MSAGAIHIPELSANPADLDRAYDVCTSILEREPNRAGIWYLRSQIVRRNAGCVEKLWFAVSDLRQALAREPDNRDYLIDLQETLRRLGQTAARLAVLRQLIHLTANHSVFAAVAAAVESGRNEKMAILQWAQSACVELEGPLNPGAWHSDQIKELASGIPQEEFDSLCSAFNAGCAMDEYAAIVNRFTSATAGSCGRLSIHADMASRSHRQPGQLVRHANIVPDAPFHFVLVQDTEHAVASVGFSFCWINGRVEIVVQQLQGTPGSRAALGSARWEHLLLAVLESFAAGRRCSGIRIVSAESNPWLHRMRRWMIARRVITDAVPLNALLESRELAEKARENWRQWWEQESRHPYFTRYIGFVDPQKLLLRYDKTARRRHYVPCEGPEPVARYWRTAVGE